VSETTFELAEAVTGMLPTALTALASADAAELVVLLWPYDAEAVMPLTVIEAVPESYCAFAPPVSVVPDLFMENGTVAPLELMVTAKE